MASASFVAMLSFTTPFVSVANAANTPVGVNIDALEPVSLEEALPANKDEEKEQEEVRLDLSFNGHSTEVEPGFLYFNQHISSAEALSVGSVEALGIAEKAKENFTPRFGEAVSDIEALAILGDDWLTNSFTPRQADAHLSFGYNSNNQDGGSKIGIALSSSVKVEGVDMPGVVNNPSLNSALNRQTYRLGVNIGYSGFNIGASLRGDQSIYSDTTSGYGVGFSYSGSSWSTSLNVGEYSRKYKNIFGNFGENETNFYSFELGASYNLNRSFRLSGGVRYLTFGKDDSYSLLEQPETQVFYLGTNFSF